MRRYSDANSIIRRGTSLLDVVAATVVTAMVIVPTSRIMNNSVRLSDRLHIRQLLLADCTNVMESALSQQSGTFHIGKTVGLIDHPSARFGFQVIASDRSNFGGEPGRRMGIQASVWHDLNRNQTWDKPEVGVSLFSTVIAGHLHDSLDAQVSAAGGPP